MHRIALSILSADFARLGEEVRAVIAAGDIRLEVDGGIKVDNIRRVAEAGADTFVAGSAIFGQPDYRHVIDAMRCALAAPLARAA